MILEPNLWSSSLSYFEAEKVTIEGTVGFKQADRLMLIVFVIVSSLDDQCYFIYNLAVHV